MKSLTTVRQVNAVQVGCVGHATKKLERCDEYAASGDRRDAFVPSQPLEVLQGDQLVRINPVRPRIDFPDRTGSED